MCDYANLDSRERSNINLSYFLGPTTKLYRIHYQLINERLDDLAKSENYKLQAVSLEIRQAIAQAYPFKI